MQFKLHLITADEEPISDEAHGYFAVILEELAPAEGKDYYSRYYHLTKGAHFEHLASVIHLMQVLSIAHHHQAIMHRCILPPAKLIQLSLNNGLITKWLYQSQPHPLEADHELWGHFSGPSPYLEQLRRKADQSLLQAGLKDVLTTIAHDRLRFSRKEHRKSTTNPTA